MELDDVFGCGDALIGDNVLAGVIAFGWAVPEKELMEEGWRVSEMSMVWEGIAYVLKSGARWRNSPLCRPAFD